MIDPPREPRLRFADFSFDVETGELRRAGAPVPLRPLATAALRQLLERPQRIVSHQELRQRLWGDAAVEWRTGIHQVIRQLRGALGDESGQPAYIETVPRRGYRFVAAIKSQTPPPARRWRSAGRSLGLVLAGALGMPLALVIVCLILAT